MSTPTKLPVAVLGAGPVGLAAASHLLERGGCCGSAQATGQVAALELPPACCGGAPKQLEGACCAADEEAKLNGGTGCGCSTQSAARTTAKVACCG